MRQHYSIVFANDYDDETVSDLLDELRQLGDTEEKERRLFEHLLQWDAGEYHDGQDEPFYGRDDRVATFDEYILSYSTRYGYAGLEVTL